MVSTRVLLVYILWLQSPGNHEFDDKIAGFRPFVKNITYPLICANCDFTMYPDLKNAIKPYIIKEVGGTLIGIIGYITVDTSVSILYLSVFVIPLISVFSCHIVKQLLYYNTTLIYIENITPWKCNIFRWSCINWKICKNTGRWIWKNWVSWKGYWKYQNFGRRNIN